jgi:hypothetical protein
MMVEAKHTYFVECYAPGIEPSDVEAAARRARVATDELRRTGTDVTYLNAILVPDDEVVFHVFEACDQGAVHEASVRAAMPFERIVESVAVVVGDTVNEQPHRATGTGAET